MTARAVGVRKSPEASHRRWLCSLFERGLLVRGRENLRCFTRALALIAWMLILSPGPLLASWELPRSELRDARNVATTHAYDRDDRLIASTVTYQPGNAQTPDTRTEWTLDDVGNRKTETVTELATNTVRANKTYTYNARDQLERITDPANDLQIDYAYDDNGNRTRREVRSANVLTSQVTYSFDARDRLIQAQPNAPNEAIVQYQYDADDRRIARIETPRVNGIPQTPITTRSIYDGSNLLHEADPAQITATYRRSAVLDRHIDHATNTVRHYQLDALRTPVAMTDAAGNTVTATTFDAWGNPTQQTANGSSTVPWQVPNYNPLTTGHAALLNADQQSIGFTGYGKDSTTGLYYANARWYDPLVGSFNAMDPAWGIAAKPVTFHRYLYANGNPTYFIDPTGKYGEAGHYYTTYYVALRSGHTDEQAQKLAFYSQLPDEVDRLDAIGVQSDSLAQRFSNWVGRNTRVDEGITATEPVYSTSATRQRDEVQRGLHALTAGNGAEETLQTLAAIEAAGSDYAATGVLIHRLGDTFAHRTTTGDTYKTGLGHGAKGHAPDVIQRRSDLYLDYAEKLATTLATKRGLGAEDAQAVAAQVRKELGDVASISTMTPGDAKGFVPTQWMQPSPPGARMPRERGDVELEQLSVTALKQKLAELGVRQRYAPETLPSGIKQLAPFVGGGFEAKTLGQAQEDFRRSGSMALDDDDDSETAVERALRLIEQQRETDKNKPVIVVEDEEG